MADDFTDSDDDRAVEDVLQQAMDHSVLEQLAAINCSSFSTTDNLPSHLETRFRKLKSLPTTTTTTTTASAAASRFPPSKSRSLRPRSSDDFNLDERQPGFCGPAEFQRKPDEKKGLESPPSIDSPEEQSDGNRNERKGLESKSKSKSSLKLDTNPDAKVYKQKDLKAKSGTGSSKSQSDSWSLSSSPESDTGTPSPPRRKIGCLWCSPKKEKSVPRKQGKENRQSSSSSLSSWGNDTEFLKTFSMKEQKKIMKKAMKEEEKINREAEKIVKWAKQASSRMMDVSGVDDIDELSDIENIK